MKKNIRMLAIVTVLAFVMIAGWLTYIQVYRGEELLTHPRNRRLQLVEEGIKRGGIFDRKGRVLAKSEAPGRPRKYPYGPVTAPVLGYVSPVYGRAGIEQSFNKELLGFYEARWNRIFGGPSKPRTERGHDLYLTLDAGLQQLAYRLLGDRRGAVVALEPATGRLLAVVSRPSFDPARLAEDWQKLIKDPASPLLNRATQGQYPPGSTMKVVTAAGAIRQNPQVAETVFNAPGYIVVDGYRIEDKQVKGRVDFRQALARSSNYVFASLALQLGRDKFIETAEQFYFNKKFSFALPYERGTVPEAAAMSQVELAESGIGQGRVMTNPLHMAMIAGAITNDGKMMRPYLVEEIRAPDGNKIFTTRPALLTEALDPVIAVTLTEAMAAVVDSGTGRAAALTAWQVAGKTGSAENPHGKAHAWFIGFAPAEKPRVAVAVVVENAGAGGETAAPIAREVLREALDSKR
jgi:peptidoglycan glycosyltransferase